MPRVIGRGEALPTGGTGLYQLEADAAGQLDRQQLKTALERGLRLACSCGREANIGRSAKRMRNGILWYVNCWRYRDRPFSQTGLLTEACILYGAVTMPAGWSPGPTRDAEERVAALERRVERLERRLRRFTSKAEGSAPDPRRS